MYAYYTEREGSWTHADGHMLTKDTCMERWSDAKRCKGETRIDRQKKGRARGD